MATGNLQQDFEAYKEKLDQWINFLGLPKVEPERSKVEEILELPFAILQTLSYIELAEFAVMLSQYALFLQKKSNEAQAFLDWAKASTNRFMSEDKAKLIVWVRNINTRLTMVAYLARRVETMVNSLSNLSRMKYNTERN
ncbi:hypothetical protein LCGC14_1717200 [marine sediment metagenome]|uniref:Uncharacterized protein n=1 Tax=marine sediment metagenome TaxID=412755 RepID=A0A0F9HDQ7_9ZZZZ